MLPTASSVAPGGGFVTGNAAALGTTPPSAHSASVSLSAKTILALLALAALILRAPAFGNPLSDVDEQFYLLVGDRMLHGALPYVDIWDRKPIGLFLIYAATRLLGGNGVIQYQLVATLFAIATAGTIATIARRISGPVASAAAGLVYLVWLNLLGGGGGQSPVFYNLLTALAALVTLRAIGAADPQTLRRHGDLAMLAMGVAIQIKTTALFEGCLFGASFLSLAWQRERRIAAIPLYALRLIAVAIAPTVAAFAAYAVAGHASDFVFANFTSIFLRSTPLDVHPGAKLVGILLMLLPLIVAAVAGLMGRWQSGGPAVRYIGGWLAVAMGGFLAVGPYYNHYGLPLLVPLSVAASLAFTRGLLWQGLLAAAGAALLYLSGFPNFAKGEVARQRLEALGSLVSSHLHGGCLFVFDGPSSLYRVTGSCLLSRYVFPNHLNYLGEANAIGVDPAAEVMRVVASRPAVIVSSDRSSFVGPNPATWAIVEAAVARNYTRVGTAIVDARPIAIYARRR